MVLGTRENIINALFRLASRYPQKKYFTLSEIAVEARVSRQAIYRKHYKNSEEILEEVRGKINHSVDQCLSLSSQNPSVSPFKTIVEVLLPEAYKYRSWLRILSISAIDSRWQSDIKQQLKEYFVPYLKKDFAKIALSQDEKAELLAEIVIDLLIVWLEQELPELPETFSRTFLVWMNHASSDFLI